jgi:hypothetical protein
MERVQAKQRAAERAHGVQPPSQPSRHQQCGRRGPERAAG